jgi:hypothetical protein
VAVPVRGIARGDPGALLVMEMVPLALPADVGANVAVKFVLCPALSVAGTAGPMTPKSAPETPI